MKFVKNYFEELKKTIDKVSVKDIKKVTDILYDCYEKDKQIFIIGNGGSASTASHFACDLGKGTIKNVYDEKEKRLRVISLTDNMPIITAIGNDLGYENIFSQQLRNLVNPKDVVVAITGSGNSENILKGIYTASKLEAISVGFTGFDGGKLKKMVDYNIHVPSDNYGIIEDIHMALTHNISAYIKKINNSKKR